MKRYKDMKKEFIYLITITISLIIFNTNHFYTKTFQENINIKNITKINDITPFYNATSIQCLDSKQINVNPYVIEDRCIESAEILNIGMVTNNLTFINTIVNNQTVFGQGFGTISDGINKIGWKSYDAKSLIDGPKGYRGIIYFNSTNDEEFKFLNSAKGVYVSEEDTIRKIWLWN